MFLDWSKIRNNVGIRAAQQLDQTLLSTDCLTDVAGHRTVRMVLYWVWLPLHIPCSSYFSLELHSSTVGNFFIIVHEALVAIDLWILALKMTSHKYILRQ